MNRNLAILIVVGFVVVSVNESVYAQSVFRGKPLRYKDSIDGKPALPTDPKPAVSVMPTTLPTVVASPMSYRVELFQNDKHRACTITAVNPDDAFDQAATQNAGWVPFTAQAANTLLNLGVKAAPNDSAPLVKETLTLSPEVIDDIMNGTDTAGEQTMAAAAANARVEADAQWSKAHAKWRQTIQTKGLVFLSIIQPQWVILNYDSANDDSLRDAGQHLDEAIASIKKEQTLRMDYEFKDEGHAIYFYKPYVTVGSQTGFIDVSVTSLSARRPVRIEYQLNENFDAFRTAFFANEGDKTIECQIILDGRVVWCCRGPFTREMTTMWSLVNVRGARHLTLLTRREGSSGHAPNNEPWAWVDPVLIRHIPGLAPAAAKGTAPSASATKPSDKKDGTGTLSTADDDKLRSQIAVLQKQLDATAPGSPERADLAQEVFELKRKLNATRQ